MIGIPPATTVTTALEEKLARATDPNIRFKLLNELISECVYTQPDRVRDLLGKMRAYFATPDSSFNDTDFYYWQHLGNLQNQEYEDDEALTSFTEAIARVDEHGDIAEKIEVYLDYLGILVNLKMMELAREYYDRSLRLLESFNSDRLHARALCRLGYFYLHDHGFAKATPKFLEALGLLNGGTFPLGAKDHYFFTLAQTGLGTLWTRPETEGRAASAFRLAIERCEAIGMRARVPWIKLKLANVLAGSDEDDGEAEIIFRSIIDSGANGSKEAMLAAYTNLGTYLSGKGNPAEEIVPLLDEAEAIFRKMPKRKNETLVSIEMTRAQLYFDEEDYAGAIQKGQETFDLLHQEGDPNNLMMKGYAVELCQLLARSYAESGEFEDAYVLQLKAEQFLDEYYALQDVKKQEEFTARFESEAREKERESLQLRASQLQLRALRAQMNPHFLYNALNSIQSFITTNDASTASKYLAKFAMLMRRSLEYTNREYITLEDEIEFLKDYLDINCHLRFDGKLTYEVEVKGDIEEDILGVPTMILQPYVENAIEHGLRTRPQGHISVVFSLIPDDDNNILASVTDDGIGRARVAEMQANDVTRPHHQSRGTEITRSRLELLTNDPDNRVLIEDLFHDSGEAAGTRVTVRIPVADVLPRRGR